MVLIPFAIFQGGVHAVYNGDYQRLHQNCPLQGRYSHCLELWSGDLAMVQILGHKVAGRVVCMTH